MGFTRTEKKKKASAAAYLADENQNPMKGKAGVVHHHHHQHPKADSPEAKVVDSEEEEKSPTAEVDDEVVEATGIHNIHKSSTKATHLPQQPTICDGHRWRLHWPMVAFMAYSHLNAVIGLVLGVTHAQVATLLWFFVLIQFGATGIICGAHRLWTHRAYKAGLPFRIFLMLCNTLALQQNIFLWSKWHRIHHKWSDTDADPHNASRGFFFAHIGWTMVHPHPQYLAKERQIDLADLRADAVVTFQRWLYLPLMAVVFLAFPVAVPWLLWGENLFVALAFNFFRYILSVHQTSLVNSAAHLFGEKVYDRRIASTKHSFTTAVSLGEAYHNYHHSFPWDYSASEFGWRVNYNPMTAVIDGAAALGLAWDLKKVSTGMVVERVGRWGDRDRVDTESRKPRAGVLLDTLQGVFWLFWALWVILLLKGAYQLSGLEVKLPLIEQMVQWCERYNTPALLWGQLKAIWAAAGIRF